jgi:hypothetical protein
VAELAFPFSPDQVAYAESLMRSVMTSSCRVVSTGAPVAGGGGEWTTPETRTEVICLIAPSLLGPIEAAAGGAVESLNRFDVTLPARTAVDSSDRIEELAAPGGAVLRTFQVIGVRAPRSFEIRRVCTCVVRS